MNNTLSLDLSENVISNLTKLSLKVIYENAGFFSNKFIDFLETFSIVPFSTKPAIDNVNSYIYFQLNSEISFRVYKTNENQHVLDFFYRFCETGLNRTLTCIFTFSSNQNFKLKKADFFVQFIQYSSTEQKIIYSFSEKVLSEIAFTHEPTQSSYFLNQQGGITLTRNSQGKISNIELPYDDFGTSSKRSFYYTYDQQNRIKTITTKTEYSQVTFMFSFSNNDSRVTITSDDLLAPFNQTFNLERRLFFKKALTLAIPPYLAFYWPIELSYKCDDKLFGERFGNFVTGETENFPISNYQTNPHSKKSFSTQEETYVKKVQFIGFYKISGRQKILHSFMLILNTPKNDYAISKNNLHVVLNDSLREIEIDDEIFLKITKMHYSDKMLHIMGISGQLMGNYTKDNVTYIVNLSIDENLHLCEETGMLSDNFIKYKASQNDFQKPQNNSSIYNQSYDFEQF